MHCTCLCLWWSSAPLDEVWPSCSYKATLLDETIPRHNHQIWVPLSQCTFLLPIYPVVAHDYLYRHQEKPRLNWPFSIVWEYLIVSHDMISTAFKDSQDTIQLYNITSSSWQGTVGFNCGDFLLIALLVGGDYDKVCNDNLFRLQMSADHYCWPSRMDLLVVDLELPSKLCALGLATNYIWQPLPSLIMQHQEITGVRFGHFGHFGKGSKWSKQLKWVALCKDRSICFESPWTCLRAHMSTFKADQALSKGSILDTEFW